MSPKKQSQWFHSLPAQIGDKYTFVRCVHLKTDYMLVEWTLLGSYYYFCFIGDETEAQEETRLPILATSSKWQSWVLNQRLLVCDFPFSEI